MVKSFIGSDIRDLVEQVRNAQEEMSDSIRGLRNLISTLKDERQRVLAVPVDLERAEARVEEWVDQRISNARRLMFHLPGSGKWSDPPEAIDFTVSPSSWQPKESDMIITMITFMKDHLVTEMKKQVRNFYDGWQQEVISEDERAAKLSQLDGKLLNAELCEESIIRAAERSGIKITRRGDADPRAVMALDIDLP